ncbi:hypothetical protein BKA65DRAFT_556744 [Rhexocercosporidium sp. MPI-PUGE-AT-0058]|nr:hypothetical protein BKA65DRAFT_556744 [Rhexocercosporidium sp. MPI-PUGE-AT-0058]
MRLFSTEKVQFVEVYGSDVPSYAILSHTWFDGEILLQDLQGADIRDALWSALSENPPEVLRGIKANGFKKVLRTTEIARRNGYDLLWVDTCCIDKTSSAELSEAINSMYRWYGGAEVCYAHLSDVPAASVESPFGPNSKFRRSRWFNRGWTLQELIASQQVEIFANDWSYLGAKTGDLDFTKLLSEVTGIQLDVLVGELSPQDMSIAARMHWAAGRQTTRVEDIAYCLLGIFDVNMPLLYGEGRRAFIRLQEAILTKEEDQSLFAWHSELLPTSTLGDIGQTGGFSGLLADSPDCFGDDNEIETSMPMILKSSPSAVTSKGLRVDFLLLPCTENKPIAEADFCVMLNCERLQDGQRESPVIYLKRIWGMGDQFARVRPDLKHFASPMADVLDIGIHERVFIKQDPWSDIRTIRIVAAKDGSELYSPSVIRNRRVAAADWKIKDAWPRKGWAENMQTFQTREFTFGIPCGVLRLEINESGQPTTIDVAVGMHAPSERLSRSWCQIMNLNPFLEPESAFLWAKQEAESSKIVYNSLSTQDIHGANVPTWIVVTERNRKRRLDITLHVLLDDARVKNELPIDRGYGQLIPQSTLTERELRGQSLVANHHPLYHLPTRAAETWNEWQIGIRSLMGEICVVDSIEISVFPRISFGSRIRTKSRHHPFPPSGAIEEYCLKFLPVDDRETRRLVEILLGYNEAGTKGDLEKSRILDASRILEKSGLSIVGKSQRGLTPLHLAFLLPDARISDLLRSNIHPAKEETFLDKMYEILEPTINNEDYPLHFAAAYATSTNFWESIGLLNIIQMLEGPQTNCFGERPIHRAAAMGNVVAVQNIMRADASRYLSEAHKVDLRGRTPLWHAACGDNTGTIAKVLLEYGAFADAADDDGLTPVHVACRQGSTRFLRRLIASGANLNLPTGALGLLPSHFAAVFGHKLCMELLIASGATIASCVGDGASLYALHLAIANGQEACARAIWDNTDPKPHFSGWSLCIVLETLVPVLKWMYLEVNNQYWIAIENPQQESGIEAFVCIGEESRLPKLFVGPGVSKEIIEEDEEAGFDDDIADEAGEEERSSITSPESSKPKWSKKARRIMKIFHSQAI